MTMFLLHNTRFAAMIAVAGVGAASLAGCGSGGSTSATGSSSTAAANSSRTSTTTSANAGPGKSGAPPHQPVGSPRSTAPPTRTASGAPRCTTAHLKVTVTASNADMQGSHSSLQFTNTGSQPCQLTGAPGVSYVAGDDGHQVGLPATRVIGHTPTVLRPGSTVSAGLFLSSAPEKTPSCQQVQVRGLRVYPPDSYTALFTPDPGIACAPPMNGPYLKVGPILPGAHNTI